jgi:hypothetical protein
MQETNDVNANKQIERASRTLNTQRKHKTQRSSHLTYFTPCVYPINPRIPRGTFTKLFLLHNSLKKVPVTRDWPWKKTV